MKIIFFGSDDFAAAHLQALIASKHEVLVCITQPDKPRGRGMKVTISPIKELALNNKIECFQPQDISGGDFLSQLKSYDSDLFIVIAYGRFLSKELINVPGKYAINVHGSLLPKYRGAAPINWAIINGEKESGVSIMKINERMDAGDVIAQKKVKINDQDTSVSLREKMLNVSPEFLVKVCGQIQKDNVALVAQDDDQATFAAKLTKEIGHIQWKDKAEDIHNLIRGLLPWPTAYTTFNGKMLKIYSSKVMADKGIQGTILARTKEGLTVGTGEGSLLIKEVQLESSKRMDAESFARGQRVEAGYVFE